MNHGWVAYVSGGLDVACTTDDLPAFALVVPVMSTVLAAMLMIQFLK